MRKGEKASDELRKKLSEVHKGIPNINKGKIFVPIEIQREKRKASRKAWESKNREKLREQHRTWKAANREKICEQARKRYYRNRETELARHRIASYGINEIEYLAMVDAQGGICAICGDKPLINLSIDHDHITGRIRGLICNPCNIALSKAKDSPKILRAMADYLERSIDR